MERSASVKRSVALCGVHRRDTKMRTAMKGRHAVIGEGAAALQLGMPKDFGLSVTGVLLVLALAVETFRVRGSSTIASAQI